MLAASASIITLASYEFHCPPSTQLPILSSNEPSIPAYEVIFAKVWSYYNTDKNSLVFTFYNKGQLNSVAFTSPPEAGPYTHFYAQHNIPFSSIYFSIARAFCNYITTYYHAAFTGRNVPWEIHYQVILSLCEHCRVHSHKCRSVVVNLQHSYHSRSHLCQHMVCKPSLPGNWALDNSCFSKLKPQYSGLIAVPALCNTWVSLGLQFR